MGTKIKLGLGSVLVLALALTAGCGKKVSEIAVEQAVKAASGGQADVKLDNGQMTITTKEEGKTSTITTSDQGGTIQVTGEKGTATMTMGDQAKVPDGWPKEVPVYAGLKIELAQADQGANAFTVAGSSPDAYDKVAAFYEKTFKDAGWSESLNMKQPDSIMLSYGKDNRQAVITATKTETGTELSVVTTSK